MAALSATARGGRSPGVRVGTVTRVDADGPYVELRRTAAGFEFGPLLTTVAGLVVGDRVIVAPLAHDPDGYVVLGRLV